MKVSDVCLHILFGLDKVEIAVIQNETEVRGHYTNLLTDKNPKLVSLDYLKKVIRTRQDMNVW